MHVQTLYRRRPKWYVTSHDGYTILKGRGVASVTIIARIYNNHKNFDSEYIILCVCSSFVCSHRYYTPQPGYWKWTIYGNTNAWPYPCIFSAVCVTATKEVAWVFVLLSIRYFERQLQLCSGPRLYNINGCNGMCRRESIAATTQTLPAKLRKSWQYVLLVVVPWVWQQLNTTRMIGDSELCNEGKAVVTKCPLQH